MNQDDLAFHYVCTHDEARELIRARRRFRVSNCGCREKRGRCNRSRMDLCLIFCDDFPGSGSGVHEADMTDVLRILEEAEDKHLVTRPFRNEKDKSRTDGICFCCDDCCGYFLNPEEKCDKGSFSQSTDFDLCNHCGVCVDVCYFHARRMVDDRIMVEQDKCYGCGLCVKVCPEECITMIPSRRTA